MPFRSRGLRTKSQPAEQSSNVKSGSVSNSGPCYDADKKGWERRDTQFALKKVIRQDAGLRTPFLSPELSDSCIKQDFHFFEVCLGDNLFLNIDTMLPL